MKRRLLDAALLLAVLLVLAGNGHHLAVAAARLYLARRGLRHFRWS